MTHAEQHTSASETIRDRLTIAKEASGMGVKALADASGVYIGDVRRYLRGTKVPDFGDLLAMAKVMDVPYAYFDRPLSEVELVSYRKHSKVTKRLERRVTIDLQIAFTNYHDIEDILEEGLDEFVNRHRVGRLPTTLEEIEELAMSIRSAIGIPLDECDPDVHSALDRKIKLLPFETKEDNAHVKLDGCLVGSNRGDLAIAFNTNAPVDRQRFTLAHELGHLVLDGEQDERTANRFAAAFLMPKPLMESRFQSGSIWAILDLKTKFGCSIGALNTRCYNLRLISGDEYKRNWMQMSYRGWRRDEPQVYLKEPQYSRYFNLCFDAWRRELITTSRLAELLGADFEDVWGFR